MSEIQLYGYNALADHIIATRQYAGETTLEVKASAIVEVCTALRDNFGFDYLSDITGIDYYEDDKRFGVAYNLMSTTEKKRLRVLARIDEKDPTIDTVCEVWPAANWFEREAWDMVGIRFRGHPDHRRIYMPEDFEYFPLRKEFPLIGIPGSIQLPEPVPPKGYK